MFEKPQAISVFLFSKMAIVLLLGMLSRYFCLSHSSPLKSPDGQDDPVGLVVYYRI